MTAARKRRKAPGAPSGHRRKAADRVWRLRLYVAGRSGRSATALENLQRICEDHLEGQYEIEVIDLLENPRLARGDQILAVPTLVRHLPPPMKKIIGDLSNTERVLVGLDLKAEPAPRRATS